MYNDEEEVPAWHEHAVIPQWTEAEEAILKEERLRGLGLRGAWGKGKGTGWADRCARRLPGRSASAIKSKYVRMVEAGAFATLGVPISTVKGRLPRGMAIRAKHARPAVAAAR